MRHSEEHFPRIFSEIFAKNIEIFIGYTYNIISVLNSLSFICANRRCRAFITSQINTIEQIMEVIHDVLNRVRI